MEVLDELMDANYIEHNPMPGQPPGLEGMKEMMGMFFAAFPDLDATIDILVAEGDLVAARMTNTGTHTGDFMGVPASGKQVSISGINIFRISGGKIVEHWVNYDAMGLMQQIGAMPEPG